MNEKVQQFMAKVDFVTEKCNIVPEFMDYAVDFMKKPVISCIPALINKITSKFSFVTIALFAVFYIVYCLKNMVISFFFESGPSGMAFGLAVAAVVITLLSIYVIYKTMGIFDSIIASSRCRISSLNIFSIMVLFFQVMAIVSFIGGIYMAFNFKYFLFLVYGVIGAIFFFLLALYNSVPEEFAVVQDENASAGEDFTAITTFAIKVSLRLIPIIIFVVPIIGIVNCIPEIFTSYVQSSGDSNYLDIGSMIASMTMLGGFLLVGLIPLIAYIYYLISYVSLDIIRALLSLPQKLDELKK